MNSSQNEAFTKALMPQWPLDDAIDWIKANLQPQDVFDLDTLKQDVSESCAPEDVFEENILTEWAERNGFTKEQE